MSSQGIKAFCKLEHKDGRGEIYSIALPNGHELMLIHSVAGALRGGHSHDCDEVVVVLSGALRYYKRQIETDEEIVRCLTPGDCAANLTNQIHMGEFLEDTWLIEYKLAKKGEWKQKDYELYRERVRASIAAG